jgi:hypothetical protein
MKAANHIDERIILSEDAFIEVVVWEVDGPTKGNGHRFSHRFSYRLALVVKGECVMHYDNETGKVDHKQIRDTEFDDEFTDIDQLLADFWNDVGDLI